MAHAKSNLELNRKQAWIGGGGYILCTAAFEAASDANNAAWQALDDTWEGSDEYDDLRDRAMQTLDVVLELHGDGHMGDAIRDEDDFADDLDARRQMDHEQYLSTLSA